MGVSMTWQYFRVSLGLQCWARQFFPRRTKTICNRVPGVVICPRRLRCAQKSFPFDGSQAVGAILCIVPLEQCLTPHLPRRSISVDWDYNVGITLQIESPSLVLDCSISQTSFPESLATVPYQQKTHRARTRSPCLLREVV